MLAPMRPRPIIPSCMSNSSRMCRPAKSRLCRPETKLLSEKSAVRRLFSNQLIRDAFDLRAELGQLFFDRFVTAIDVIDALDVRAPFGHESREHQAGGGTQIRRHHWRSSEPLHA